MVVSPSPPRHPSPLVLDSACRCRMRALRSPSHVSSPASIRATTAVSTRIPLAIVTRVALSLVTLVTPSRARFLVGGVSAVGTRLRTLPRRPPSTAAACITNPLDPSSPPTSRLLFLLLPLPLPGPSSSFTSWQRPARLVSLFIPKTSSSELPQSLSSPSPLSTAAISSAAAPGLSHAVLGQLSGPELQELELARQ